MKNVDIISAVLLLVGGLNWGLWGLFEFDLIAAVFGGPTAGLSKFVYFLVGLSALYQIFAMRTIRRRWLVLPHRERPEIKRAA